MEQQLSGGEGVQALLAGLQLLGGRLSFLFGARKVDVFLSGEALIGEGSIVSQPQVVLARFVYVGCQFLIRSIGVRVVWDWRSFLLEAIVLIVVVLKVPHLEGRLAFGVKHGIANLNFDVGVVHELRLFLCLLFLLLSWPSFLGVVRDFFSAFHKLLVIEFL